jgi:tetratricopeptide (TPR) repeat protein
MANNEGPGLSLQGGAAIVAPISAFPNGVPGNALVLLPLSPDGQMKEEQLVDGPIALTMDQLWKTLGFNGPAVQVQDNEGRPILVGLEDLLSGLEQHWQANQEDLNSARIYAQKLMEHQRFEKAEVVLSKIVARGVDGNDWLGLGIAQLAQKKFEKAEKTLTGAQNLLKTNPLPSLHLARLAKEKGDRAQERTYAEKSLTIDGNFVDGWAYLFGVVLDTDGEEKAVAALEQLASKPEHSKTASPYIALQSHFAADDAADSARRDQATGFAKKAVDRAPGDPLALLCLSALYGQAEKFDEVVKLLAPHEALMARDVRVANNYFQALFAMQDLKRVTALLNKLATSSQQDVKQFAIERSRAVQQMLQQQQQSLPS